MEETMYDKIYRYNTAMIAKDEKLAREARLDIENWFKSNCINYEMTVSGECLNRIKCANLNCFFTGFNGRTDLFYQRS